MSEETYNPFPDRLPIMRTVGVLSAPQPFIDKNRKPLQEGEVYFDHASLSIGEFKRYEDGLAYFEGEGGEIGLTQDALRSSCERITITPELTDRFRRTTYFLSRKALSSLSHIDTQQEIDEEETEEYLVDGSLPFDDPERYGRRPKPSPTDDIPWG